MSLISRFLKVGFIRLELQRTNLNYRVIRRNSSNISIDEINIDVPWGHIAGRHWNGSDRSRKPVICLHGWKDNSATFDRLLPIIIPSLDKYQFVCVDLPGHGLSSHYPPGMTYYPQDCFMWILRVLRHFGWSKATIIGHSMGAVMGFIFTSMYPSLITQLVAIDGLTPVVFSQGDVFRMLPDVIDHLILMEDKLKEQQPPTYTLDQVLDKMMTSHMMGMHEIACKTLMTRGVVEDPVGSGKYRFCHDIRVQYLPVTMFDHKQISYLAKNFKSGLLFLKAGEGVNYMSNYLNTNIESWIKKGNKKSVKFVRFEKATHHLHLIEPDSIAENIVEFLQK